MIELPQFRRPVLKSTVLFVFAAAGLLRGADVVPQQPPLIPNPPRTIVVAETQAPPVIRAALLQSTLIVLPDQEKVATVFGGDTAGWIFDGGHVPSRFISIKPRVADGTTNLHIVSDHGNEYTLQMKEITGDPDPHFDAKVFLEPGDKQAKEKLIQLPVFVPASDVQEKIGRMQKELDTANAAAAEQQKRSQTDAQQFRSSYPGRLHFDYTWEQKKAARLGLQEIWRDDKFTYLRGHFQEPPALYELKDGKGSLINFDFSNGLYTVPKTVDSGYLAIGKERMEFKRTGDD